MQVPWWGLWAWGGRRRGARRGNLCGWLGSVCFLWLVLSGSGAVADHMLTTWTHCCWGCGWALGCWPRGPCLRRLLCGQHLTAQRVGCTGSRSWSLLFAGFGRGPMSPPGMGADNVWSPGSELKGVETSGEIVTFSDH